MSKRDLLLEIGLEEMPARFVTQSMNQLGEKTIAFLQEQNIEHGEVSVFSTPRRLAVIVKDVAEAQADINEEAKGPAKKIAVSENGEWSKAAIGFAKSQGLNAENIYFKELKGVEYAHVKKFVKGRETKELLPALKETALSLTFGKNMRWGSSDIRYVRPIKWVVALYGSETISFELAGVLSGNKTMGHRFLGQEAEIKEAALYEKTLEDQFVMADPSKRRQAILNGLKKLESEHNWVIPVDESLLEEVNNLVEYPTAFTGAFNETFLSLPPEVLITSMKEHQRYFPVKNAAGELLSHFAAVRNGNDFALDNVARGNEKVLRARLADADFFYKEDQKADIDELLKKLEKIVYHEKIGKLSEKVARIRRIAGRLADISKASEETKAFADRAAQICKFDLVTQMVYEFPELQGIMGEKYARQKSEPTEVAAAINEHYMPRSAEDSVPSTQTGALVSLADKLDTIVSCFAVGIIPTGSQDPYALRRQAAGIVQTMLEHNWQVSIEEVIQTAVEEVKKDNIGERESSELSKEINAFFAMRVKHIFQAQNIRQDIIEAVLAKSAPLPEIKAAAQVLMAHKDQADFKETIEALSRVVNIAKKASGSGETDPALFENNEEKALFSEYEHLSSQWSSASSMQDRYEYLASLKTAIEHYFDHTMVMAEDEKIKNNRLSFMQQLAHFILDFAYVPAIMVK